MITVTGSCAVEMSDHIPRTHSHKLLGMFRLGIRKKTVSLENGTGLDQVPGEVVASPSLEASKTQLVRVLADLT